MNSIMNARRGLICKVFLALLPLIVAPACLAAEPLKGGVETKGYVNTSPMQGYADYPAPTMIPQQGQVGAAAAPLQGGASAIQRPRPPIQAGIQKAVQLPPAFLGAWNVQGQRSNVE